MRESGYDDGASGTSGADDLGRAGANAALFKAPGVSGGGEVEATADADHSQNEPIPAEGRGEGFGSEGEEKLRAFVLTLAQGLGNSGDRITLAMLALMVAIDGGTRRMSDLAARVERTTAYATTAIDALERRGLAARRINSTDRRSWTVELTERGRARLARELARIEALRA